MSPRAARRVLLIGWDGADWKIIQQLLDAGQMPHLERLVNEGVSGSLAALRPLVPPMLWASVATGKRADRHGVLGGVEPRSDGTGVRPVSSGSLRARPLWSILPRHGLTSAVVGWCATHPAHAVGDIVVSDAFPRAAGADFDAWPMPPDAVAPERLRQALFELRVHPADLDPAQVRYFVPGVDQVDMARDERPARLARWLAQCATVHAAGTHLAEHERWDLLAIHYDTIGRVAQDFMTYRGGAGDAVAGGDGRLYGEVVDAAYRFHDLMLGRYMRLVGPETTVFVVSAHGVASEPGPTAATGPRDLASPLRPSGILVARGPGIKRDELVFGASVLDIAPTVLALLDLPVGRDMEGRPLTRIFDAPVEIRHVDTHESGGDTGAGDEAADDPEAAREALAQLAALGYVEAPAPSATRAIEAATVEHLFNLAEVHLVKGEPARAAELLEEMLLLRPRHRGARLRLAQCRLDLGDVAGCRTLAAGLVSEAPDTAWAHLAEGLIRFAEEDLDGALEALHRAESGLPWMSALQVRIGAIQLRRKAWPEAEAAFRKAVDADESEVKAWDGLGAALYAQGRYEEATEPLIRSVALVYERPRAHLQLGMALAAAGYLDGAVERLRTALDLDPTLKTAHRYLAAVYRAKGEALMARFHREEARR